MTGQDQGSGYTPSGEGKLAKEPLTLKSFQGRIDAAVEKLEKSKASSKSMGDQKVPVDAFGVGFGSAKDLAGLYDKVHERLLALSKVFGDQLEATGLAAVIAERGYDGIDAEEAEKLRSIQKRTQEYERDRAAALKRDAPGGGGTSGGGGGF
ncbi:hypothetical protein [Streptomyces eurocidicus]|uniref:Uncharacterized protein n=1 Tax=Streptomyces eurocidicus TaxID=66423 RepID=A0A7W8F073_STREU|nr:hypothetical protein [Streptomyces eurocidicus]MBB5116629.1 hypothetical protein [Streptomyces eurocidicus]MBF6052369.1 hypothetical protein [Streptomyces eurocidicus]